MQHTAILDIGACSDLYIMYISTNHNERPDPNIISQTNVHQSRRCYRRSLRADRFVEKDRGMGVKTSDILTSTIIDFLMDFGCIIGLVQVF